MINKYLVAGISIASVSAAAAVILNSMGYSCLTQLANINQQGVLPENMETLEQDCFAITNSYVYSLFGVIAGIIVAYYGYRKNQNTNGKKE